MAAIACFAALAGGTAYAANTIRTGDIVDNEVTSPDVRDDTLGFGGLAARDLGPGSVGSSEVVDNSLGSLDVHEESMLFNNTLNVNDVGPSAVASSEVADSTLNDEDIGQATFVNFEANIGQVLANSCKENEITGINAQGDHLLLTPSADDSRGQLIYTALYSAGPSTLLQICNPTTTTLEDGTTHFNLLVIDAQ